MNNSTNVTVIAHFNDSIIKNIEECGIFMSDEPTYFFIPQITSFEELNAILCQGINADT